MGGGLAGGALGALAVCWAKVMQEENRKTTAKKESRIQHLLTSWNAGERPIPWTFALVKRIP
jgi:hypothetical protein